MDSMVGVGPDGFGAFGTLFAVMFTLVPLAIAGVFVLVVVSAVRNRRTLRDAGYDPLTVQSQMAVRAMDSQLMAPRRTLGERLAELDALRAAGTISPDEHAAARAAALAEG